MSIIQRSATMLKRLLQPCRRNLLKYGTVTDKMTDDLDSSIVWIDMEMTGLDVNTCHVLEVACIITDGQLKIISDEFSCAINQSDHILNNMNEWCLKHHGKSGLIDDCRNSKVSLEKAEKELLEFVKSYVPEGKCPLGGNTVYMDRMFLSKYMPLVNNYLHYRIIDTSTLKELTRRWFPEVYKIRPEKEFAHRALADIKESINELKYYKNSIFNS